MGYGTPARCAFIVFGLGLVAPMLVRAQAVDNEPPGIIHVPVAEAKAGQAVEITAKITDKSGVFEPTLFFRVVGSAKFTSSGMTGSGDTYVATIPASLLKSDVEYFIEAYDTPGNGPARFASADAPQRIIARAAEVAKVAATEVAPTKAVATVSEATSAQTASNGGMKLGGYGLLGAGGVAGVVGAILGLSAASAYERAKTEPSARGANDLFTGAQSKGTAANVSFVAAGVLASAGAVLLVLSRPAPTEQAISMTLGPAGLGLAAAGTF